ncbi:Lrp/AsnC family transcriptional regulator [Corticimicrobacter populi]|uniref:Lrp/AsnC family transcriptional regulator n=1 Tax=Corticimicrobacter populi TaxID=2175229 RepID=A0A2V1K5S4_9BURK|nr:Lrp/AsnC family transcriptional regulator [Corticimicrobacter populi]PWF24240.1 Lrp/AsnC family transcriptional regulator [Corticimicrobacter populi]
MPNEIKETNTVKQVRHQPAKLDDVDRRILGILAQDSSRSYVDLGQELHLSAPAVHDRVKRLKRDGVIKATVAKIDGCKVGRTLLAFVLVNTKNVVSTKRLLSLGNLPEIEEMHTVAGDSGVLLKVRVRETEGLEDLLGKLQDIEGVDGTRSYIVLSTFVERGPDPGE